MTFDVALSPGRTSQRPAGAKQFVGRYSITGPEAGSCLMMLCPTGLSISSNHLSPSMKEPTRSISRGTRITTMCHD